MTSAAALLPDVASVKTGALGRVYVLASAEGRGLYFALLEEYEPPYWLREE